MVSPSSNGETRTTSDPGEDTHWQRFLGTFEDEVEYYQFRIFGTQLELLERDAEQITIRVPRSFHKEWLTDKQNEALHRSVEQIYGESTDVRIVVENDACNRATRDDTESQEDEGNVNREFPFAKSNGFNPDFTFDSFVVGDSNEYAYAAARALTEDPVNSYNPLFIYGGVGLGKTHLLQAIGHEVKAKWEQSNIKCIAAEQFTNEIIHAIRENNTKEFKYRFRNVDMFLVDDVQFLSKTDAAQEEFFHTFNELHQKGKATVFCSDRPPQEIGRIEERLRSRFSMGLIVDIQPPDYETRMAILQQKAAEEGLDIEGSVLDFIATHITGNVRRLESSLTRLSMKASLSGHPITCEVAEDELQDLIDSARPENGTVVTVEDIQSVVADHYDLTVQDLTSKKRTRAVARPRQVAMHLAREKTDRSFSDIGELFGGRDHSTVIHAHNKIAEQKNDDAELTAHLRRIKRKLQEPV